jgi:DNA helicase IV
MHPDLPHEQAYFDRALALRDRQQAHLARAPSLAAHPKAAVELRKRVSRLGLTDPDEAVAFGRIEAANDRWYIGKGAIWGDDNDLVVVNWQAPIAAAFYTATPDEPQGLDARRLYRCTGNQIREIEDLVFREVARAVASGRTPEPVLTDALLESLGSARSGELGDIVATIQAAQYDVISRPLDQLLVVQGGPGTGKTVVGLHRVSWLLYNRRDRLEARDVLIVGPNPAFVRYISSVLPSLGDGAVVQLPLRALGPRVRIGRVDPPELRRLKGDRRLLRLILRGVRNRQRVEARPVELTIEGRRVELDGRRIATRARQLAGRPHNEAYRMLRAFIGAEVGAALARIGAAEVAVQGESARAVDNHLARVWPTLTPQAFLVGLLSSRRQLLAAGAGTLSDVELGMLALPSDAQVSTWQWSADDVPLLDTADALLNGVPATYEHIVVDEAQDLSPLQLESIRRRSRAGSITVLGDLAQGTSPWAHEAWDAVVQVLRHERVGAETVGLEYGYRLPAEVHEVAMRLLPEAAPGLASPDALRSSGHEVVVATAEQPEGLVPRVVATVRQLVGDGIVGVIAPGSVRAELVRGLDDDGIAWASELRPSAATVVLLAPDEAKGLEFDVVIVVEPSAIVDESEHGVRALFVAMTRCTSRLALVHARPLPPVLGLGGSPAGELAPSLEGPEPSIDDAAGETATGGDEAPAPGLVDLVAVDRATHPDPDRGDDAGDDTLPMLTDDVDEGSEDRPTVDVGEGSGDRPTVEVVEGSGDRPTVEVSDDAVDRPTVEVVDHAGSMPTVEVGDGPAAVPVADVGDDAVAMPASSFDEEGDDVQAVPVEATAPGRATIPPSPVGTGDEPRSPGHDLPADDEPSIDRRDPSVAVGAATGEEAPVLSSSVDPDASTVLAAIDDLDHDIARAIAATVADKLAHLLAPPLLPIVAEELARALGTRAEPPTTTPPIANGEATNGRSTNGGATSGEADAEGIRPPVVPGR